MGNLEQISNHLNIFMKPLYPYICGALIITVLLLMLLLKRKSKAKAKVKAAVHVSSPEKDEVPVSVPVPASVPSPKEFDPEQTYTAVPIPDLAKQISESQDMRNFAKIFIVQRQLEKMCVYAVNNEEPSYFTEKGKTGIYMPKGSVEIRAEYLWPQNKIKFSHEDVSSGIKKVCVAPIADRIYYLSFDTEKENFMIS